MTTVVRMEKITKRYGYLLANDRVDLEIFSGEIHAIVGENGAGKSTLMHILCGFIRPTSGRIMLDGEAVSWRSARDATFRGVGMVHQQFMLIPRMTVLENVVLGHELTRGPFLDRRAAERELKALCGQFGFDLEPHCRVEELPMGLRQQLELVRLLYRRSRVLILDEPSAMLAPQESEGLFRVLQRLRDAGHTIIFITHKLGEIFGLGDRITVMRGGRKVGTFVAEDTDASSLAGLVVGRELEDVVSPRTRQPGAVILRIEDLRVEDDTGRAAIQGVSLDVHEGEILGLAGVSGNGQIELVEALAGLRHVTHGRILLDGVETQNQTPRKARDRGLAYIPEDGPGVGMVEDFTLGFNLVLTRHWHPPFSSHCLLNLRAITRHAYSFIQEFDIRPSDPEFPGRALSGGNKQRLVIARELGQPHRLLVAMHPTRGLDVRAARTVHRALFEKRNQGKAILLVSADLSELLSLSDRIAVLYRGKLQGIMESCEATMAKLGRWMLGLTA
ncbi:MAG: ABC transporter ATP-binding protein [Deltaproteobacteria bacterium]|nr:ABC transporter ATP-binding protein [Deltaproteobacteria bacterium]MBW2306918.1 ABC transporter ATP-binding protein [Deltaproteobacteria bacterium]